jgi:hypothetical protein
VVLRGEDGSSWRCALSHGLRSRSAVGTFVFIVTATLSLPDWTIATPIAAVGAVVIWSTGRAARYVLSRR